MFNYFYKFLVTFLFCTVPIVAMEREIKAALGVSILAYLYREKANAELLNVMETYVIPFYQKEEKFGNEVKILMKNININDITQQIVSKMEKEIIQIKNQYKITEEREEYWEKIKKCLENGASPNLKTKVPLFLLAVKEQRKDIFNLLLRLRAAINTSADISVCDIKCGSTPLNYVIRKFTKNPGSDGIQIEDLLQNGADPNVLNEEKKSPLELAIILDRDIDFIKPLINYRANVNHKDLYGNSILTSAIFCHKKHASIRVLCDAGASLTDVDSVGNNAFHILANSKNEELIKTVITHGHVDFEKERQTKEISRASWLYGKQEEVPITQTIKGALLAFNRLSYPLEIETQKKDFTRFPIILHEIQLYILSKLFAEDYFHWGLYKKLMPRYKPCPLFLLNKHVECLIQILETKNKENKTALQQLHTQNCNPECIDRVLELFNGSKLCLDLDEFKKLYNTALVPEDNLVSKIYQNHYFNFQKTEKTCNQFLASAIS